MINFDSAKEPTASSKTLENTNNKKNKPVSSPSAPLPTTNGEMDKATLDQNRANFFARMNKKPKAKVEK